MVLFGNLLGALLAARTSAVPAEEPQALEARQGGFTTENWSNDYGDVNFTSGSAGAWSAKWNNGPGGDLVVGKGYRPGGDMLFNYTGSFHVTGNAYLALYGWTTNPLVEYYVIESMGNHNPSDNHSATRYGTVQSDGGTYEIWQKPRYGDSIVGTTSFQQFWSIRTKTHVGGTINTGNHFRAWEAAGLKLGTQNYMIMGVEGQQGSGTANITVGVRPTTSVPETTTSTRRTDNQPHPTRPPLTSASTSVKPTTTTSKPFTTSSSQRPSFTTSSVEPTVTVIVTETRTSTSSRRSSSVESTITITITQIVTALSTSKENTVTRTVTQVVTAAAA